MNRINGGEEALSLLERLEAYGRTDAYPFHMPGHKRNVEMGITLFPNPFSVDITEIEGFDNLHHPEGILKDSMEKAALIYGTDETYFLVNGSTCGILSAICASARRGGTFIMARNCHKSAYHACLINGLKPVYVYPDYIASWGIQGGVNPERIKVLLEEYPESKAVFLTSPTYEGIVSDVEYIARIVHQAGAILIVDEAHGAHFSFGKNEGERYFPKSAIDCGADLVIQSIHKTLPSLTQTALLHVTGERVDRNRLRHFLQIFQSSSPSYVFLASIENCIRFMDKEGRKALSKYGEQLKARNKSVGGLEYLRLLGEDIRGSFSVKDRDISKILVSTERSGKTGAWLASRLRDRYHLEPEMACSGYALYMTSLMDTEKGLDRLFKALIETDRELSRELGLIGRRTESGRKVSKAPESDDKEVPAAARNAPESSMSIADAWDAEAEEIPVSASAGHVSAGFVTVYPPGIPALAPGERITDEIASDLLYCAGLGLTVEGLSAQRTIQVVRIVSKRPEAFWHNRFSGKSV